MINIISPYNINIILERKTLNITHMYNNVSFVHVAVLDNLLKIKAVMECIVKIKSLQTIPGNKYIGKSTQRN